MMRRFVICSVVVGFGALAHTGAATADVRCAPGDGPASACVTTGDSSADARASTSTAPGGGAGVAASPDGAIAWGDGGEANPGPTSGWVVVSASSGGPAVDCGSSGAPGTAGCDPAG
jgi:hypothetical protein